MKGPLFFCVVSLCCAVGFAALAISVYQRLETERERTKVESIRVASLEEEVSLLRGQQLRSGQAVRLLTAAASSSVTGGAAEQSSPDSQNKCNAEGAQRFVEEEGRRMGEELQRENAARLQNPQSRKEFLDGVLEGLRPQYAEFFREQNIPPDMARRMLEIYAEQHMNALLNSRTAEHSELVNQEKKLQPAVESDIAALLGTRYVEFQEYQKTMPERNVTRNVSRMLGMQIEAPLKPEQAKKMIAILVQEKAMQGQWATDDKKRVLAKVKSVLKSDQYKALERDWLGATKVRVGDEEWEIPPSAY